MTKSNLSRGYVVKAGASRTPPLPQSGRSLVTTEDSNGAFMIAESSSNVAGPGALHVHHDHDEVMYVLEGEVIATVGETIHHLCASELVYLPKGVPHRLEFPTTARWLLIGSGGYDQSRGELSSAFAKGLKGVDVYAEIGNVDFVSD